VAATMKATAHSRGLAQCFRQLPKQPPGLAGFRWGGLRAEVLRLSNLPGPGSPPACCGRAAPTNNAGTGTGLLALSTALLGSLHLLPDARSNLLDRAIRACPLACQCLEVDAVTGV
jgi:hypothetical protein